MSGITGIFLFNGSNNYPDDLLVRMCDTLKVNDDDPIDTYTNDTLEIGHTKSGTINIEQQPLWNKDKSICLFLHGELYDYPPGRQSEAAISDAHLLLELYQEFGESFVTKVDGSFIVVLWDNPRKKLLIANDRYGLRPLYYTRINNRLMFASRIKSLLKDESIPRKMNDTAVAQFFSFGFLPGDNTFFEDIKVLDAASVAVCSESGWSISEYWKFTCEKVQYDSRAVAAEKMSGLLKNAVKKRLKGQHKIGMLLSGGLDSRVVAAGFLANGISPHTFTFGMPVSQDVVFAETMAKIIKSTHHFCEINANFLPSCAERIVDVTDGMLCVYHYKDISTFDEAKKYCDMLLTGSGGDAIIGKTGDYVFNYYGMLDIEDDDHLCQRMFTRHNKFIKEADHPSFFSRDYYGNVKGKARDSFNKVMEKSLSAASSRVNQTLHFLVRQYERRFVLQGQNPLGAIAEYRLPFYDHDLISYVLSLPAKVRKGQILYKKAITKVSTELARVPVAGADALPVTAGLIRIRISRIMHRLRRLAKLPEKFSGSRRYKDDYHDFPAWLRNENKSFMLDILLDEKTRSRGYFNQDHIRDIIETHMTGNKDYSEELLLLTTFELMQRKYFEN